MTSITLIRKLGTYHLLARSVRCTRRLHQCREYHRSDPVGSVMRACPIALMLTTAMFGSVFWANYSQAADPVDAEVSYGGGVGAAGSRCGTPMMTQPDAVNNTNAPIPNPAVIPPKPVIITGGCRGCNSAFVTGLPRAGLATWTITEPSVDLWLVDTPLRYNASRGHRVSFKLAYKNRQGQQGSTENAVAGIYSVGSRWHTPWRVYLEAIPSESTNFWVYPGEGTAVKYTLDVLDYRTLAKLTQISSTNVILYPDGAKDVFGQTVVLGGVSRYFLTRREDVYGNATSFQYVSNNNTIRLDKILDVDNRSITFEYAAKGNYSNVLTKVIGPHGLTNILEYDSLARLTNVTDSVGLRSQMQYDSANLTSLTTRAHCFLVQRGMPESASPKLA